MLSSSWQLPSNSSLEDKYLFTCQISSGELSWDMGIATGLKCQDLFSSVQNETVFLAEH